MSGSVTDDRTGLKKTDGFYSALVLVDGRQLAETVAAAGEKMTPFPTAVSCIEIEEQTDLWEVGLYFGQPPNEILLDLLSKAFKVSKFIVSCIPKVDWVSKVQRELKPVRAGRFLVQTGCHDAVGFEDSASIEIKSSMAFGTGHHGSTKGCLLALDDLADEVEQVEWAADIGCGTGILAMAVAKSWPATVFASDIDPLAVQIAQSNVVANELSGQVNCFEAAGFDHGCHARSYDLIVANILSGPLINLASEVARHLNWDGLAVLSGLRLEEVSEVAKSYESAGMRLDKQHSVGDWATLTMKRA